MSVYLICIKNWRFLCWIFITYFFSNIWIILKILWTKYIPLLCILLFLRSLSKSLCKLYLKLCEIKTLILNFFNCCNFSFSDNFYRILFFVHLCCDCNKTNTSLELCYLWSFMFLYFYFSFCKHSHSTFMHQSCTTTKLYCSSVPSCFCEIHTVFKKFQHICLM